MQKNARTDNTISMQVMQINYTCKKKILFIYPEPPEPEWGDAEGGAVEDPDPEEEVEGPEIGIVEDLGSAATS